MPASFVAEEADRLDREIGLRLKAVRRARGLTQTDLGDLVGASFQRIQKYEAGRNRISGSMLILLARALDIDPGVLLGSPTPEAAHVEVEGAWELLACFRSIRSPDRRRLILDLTRDVAAGGDPEA